MGALEAAERYITADYEFADDPRAYRGERAVHEGNRIAAERITVLLINAVGGPFVQRKPTRAECRTEQLDYFASRVREGSRLLRARSVRTRLDQLGLTTEQVEAWAKPAAPVARVEAA